MPALTEERRKEYIKMAKHEAEEARVSSANIRRHAKEAIEKFVKDGEVGEDDGTRGEKDLEQLTKSSSTRSTTWSTQRKPSSSRSER